MSQNKSATCQISYDYKDVDAYPSVGVEYVFDIKNANAFTEAISSLYKNIMPKGWELLNKVSDKDSGRPGYSSDALPLVFKRETRSTVEYLDVFNAIDFYVELTIYER